LTHSKGASPSISLEQEDRGRRGEEESSEG